MPQASKIRLDQALTDKGLVSSRQQARGLIMAGKILVDGKPVDKPGYRISEESTVTIRGTVQNYVSRGGLKLEGALNAFALDVTDFLCLDVGASTGGFTDCLLQRGARRIFAVDVGYGQLAWPLRQDERVEVIERTNIRHLSRDAIPVTVDLITIDVSFISLKIVVPACLKFLKNTGRIIPLIKPQFEVGKGNVGKGGVVRDPSHHAAVIETLVDFFDESGLESKRIVPSPILGPKGNKEFFALLHKKRRFD